MAKAASIHFCSAKVSADKHNRRDKDLSHVRKELEKDIPRDKWMWEDPCYKSVLALKKQAEKEYHEKEITVTGNHGTYVTHRSMPKNAEPVKEGVVAIDENVTMEQLRQFGDWCHREYGIKPMAYYIHYGEGHWAPLKDDQTADMYRRDDGNEWCRINEAGEMEYWKPNLHAHIVFDWFNHDTKRCYNLRPKDMVSIEDKLAEYLNMQRGERSDRQWLDSVSFKIKAERERAEKEKAKHLEELSTIEREVAKAKKTVASLTTMINNIQEKIQENNGDIKELEKKKADKEEKLKNANEQLEYAKVRLENYQNRMAVAEGKLKIAEKYARLATIDPIKITKAGTMDGKLKQQMLEKINHILHDTKIPKLMGQEKWLEDRGHEIKELLNSYFKDIQESWKNTQKEAETQVENIYKHYMQLIDSLPKKDKELLMKIEESAIRKTLLDVAESFGDKGLTWDVDNGTELGKRILEQKQSEIEKVADYYFIATHQNRTNQEFMDLVQAWHDWRKKSSYYFDNTGQFRSAMIDADRCLYDYMGGNKNDLRRFMDAFSNIIDMAENAERKEGNLFFYRKEVAEDIAKGIELMARIRTKDDKELRDLRIILAYAVEKCEEHTQISPVKQDNNTSMEFKNAVKTIAEFSKDPSAHWLSPNHVHSIMQALNLFEAGKQYEAAEKMIDKAKEEEPNCAMWIESTGKQVMTIAENFSQLSLLFLALPDGGNVSEGGGEGNNQGWRKKDDEDEWLRKFYSIMKQSGYRKGTKRI